IDRLYARWLAPLQEQPDWVEDADWARLQQEPLRARALLYAIAIVLMLLLLWAALATVDEVARGEGKVIPSRQLQIIQSFDGGVVEEILVSEGQVVNAGDLLLRIDSTRFVSNFRENRAQYLALEARAARLQALTTNSALVFSAELNESAPDIATHERNLYQSSRSELDEQLTIARTQLEQREEELNEVRAKVAQAQRAFELVSQELNVTRPLLT